MEDKKICHQGVVKEVLEDKVLVETIVSSACSQCHSKAFCSMSEQKEEIFTIPTHEAKFYRVGDEVLIQMRKELGAKAVLFAYIGPLLALCLALFVTYYFTHHELLSVGVSFGALTIYFVVLRLCRDKFQDIFTLEISKKKQD